MSAILLALAAGISWGFSDFGAGIGSRRLPVPLVIAGVQVSGLVFVGLVAAIVRPPLPSAAELGYGGLAGALGLLGLFAFYRALAVGAMGIVGPLAATGTIAAMAYGLARGERPSTLQLAGVGFTVVGVIVTAVERHPTRAGAGIGAGVGLALLAALCFGAMLIVYSKAVAGGAVWATLMTRSVGAPLILLSLVFLRTPLTGLRTSWWLSAVGVCDNGANLLFGLAVRRGLLSVVSVLGSLYPVVLVILARTFLHERVARHQLAGVGIALTGVALISAG